MEQVIISNSSTIVNTLSNPKVLAPTQFFIENGITRSGAFFIVSFSFLIYGLVGGFILSRYLKSNKNISLDLGLKIVFVYHFIGFLVNYIFLSLAAIINWDRLGQDALTISEISSFFLKPDLLPFTIMYIILGLFFSYMAGGLIQMNQYRYFYYGYSVLGRSPLFEKFIESNLNNDNKGNPDFSGSSNFSTTTINGKEVSPDEAQKLAEEINKFTQSMKDKTSKK